MTVSCRWAHGLISRWEWKEACPALDATVSLCHRRRHSKSIHSQSGRMNFRVVSKTWSNQGRARVGTLTLPGLSISVETPCLLLSTRKGLPHFLSPDLLSALPTPDSNLLAVSPLHFVKAIPTETISKIGGLHQMLGLQEYGFAAVPRDSIVALPDTTSTNKKGASFETSFGRLLINPAECMKMIDSLKPNWWVSLAAEVPIGVSEKRHKMSVDRTLRWLDECITLSKTDGAAFGAIVGGCFVEECKRCVAEVVKRNVFGYWIGGFGLGKNIDDHRHLLDTICGILPEEKPRQLSGLGSPGMNMNEGMTSVIDEDDYQGHEFVGGDIQTDQPSCQGESVTSSGQPFVVGMMFEIMDEARQHYVDYGKGRGFLIRTRTTSKIGFIGRLDYQKGIDLIQSAKTTRG
ncbi:hypothetical protein Droror1_Dr00026846 [Drosera rotundifolia]